MYVAVLLLIVGQAVFFASTSLWLYGVTVWIAVHLFVRYYEEPTLSARFGNDYDDYQRRVPRWIPRIPSKGA